MNFDHMTIVQLVQKHRESYDKGYEDGVRGIQIGHRLELLTDEDMAWIIGHSRGYGEYLTNMAKGTPAEGAVAEKLARNPTEH